MQRKIRFVEEQVGSQWLITSPDIPGLYIAHKERDVARANVRATVEAMDAVRSRVANKMAVEHRVAQYA